MYAIYGLPFTINIPPMLAYIYTIHTDPMGLIMDNSLGESSVSSGRRNEEVFHSKERIVFFPDPAWCLKSSSYHFGAIHQVFIDHNAH